MTKIEIPTTVPVTVNVDFGALLSQGMPEAYDHENDEVIYGGPLYAALVAQAATHIAETCRKDIAEAAAEAAQKQVALEVGKIVAQTLEEGVTIGDGYSRTKVKPLKELIKDEVDEWVKGGSKAESWDSRKKNPLHELIRKEVDAAMTTDLRGSIAEAKATAQAAVKAKAAEIVAAAVVR